MTEGEGKYLQLGIWVESEVWGKVGDEDLLWWPLWLSEI